jgi:hypothetical protein
VQLFRRSKGEKRNDAPDLRGKALTVTAADLQISPDEQHPRVWGVLMETGYPEAVATLATFAEGSTSLYFSNGGGIIGAGEHLTVRDASKRLLMVADRFYSHLEPATETPMPGLGRVRFYIHGFDGLRTAEADENDLGYERHPLSPVFHQAHDVIGHIRMASEPGAR